MDLWSKGLGKRVLSLALVERDSMVIADDELVIEGVMHAPTYWDYAVTLDRRDVTDFLGLLQEPETVRFVFEDESRNDILKTALFSAVLFGVRTLRMALTGPPGGRTPATGTVDRAGRPPQTSEPRADGSGIGDAETSEPDGELDRTEDSTHGGT
jgi:hypothetical protein